MSTTTDALLPETAKQNLDTLRSIIVDFINDTQLPSKMVIQMLALLIEEYRLLRILRGD